MPRFLLKQMKYEFAALRFTADKNLSDRLYWYLSLIPLQEGEKVLAPVGVHDRLQCAQVERVVWAEEAEAPYDPSLIKQVTAKYGARKLVIGGEPLLEFGGLKYDDRHFTPFGRLLLAEFPPTNMMEICTYGVTKLLEMGDGEELWEEIARSLGGVLLIGEEGKKTFARLIALCRGEECGISEALAGQLKEKLL